MDRKVWAFALAGVAAVLEMDGATVSRASIVLGGVAPVPIRATAAEEVLVGSTLDEDLLATAAEAALADARPLAHNGYKVPLTKTLVRDALREAVG
jgi:xanthine dehydrogenase YagS FAD-binding subunit